MQGVPIGEKTDLPIPLDNVPGLEPFNRRFSDGRLSKDMGSSPFRFDGRHNHHPTGA